MKRRGRRRRGGIGRGGKGRRKKREGREGRKEEEGERQLSHPHMVDYLPMVRTAWAAERTVNTSDGKSSWL